MEEIGILCYLVALAVQHYCGKCIAKVCDNLSDIMSVLTNIITML